MNKNFLSWAIRLVFTDLVINSHIYWLIWPILYHCYGYLNYICHQVLIIEAGVNNRGVNSWYCVVIIHVSFIILWLQNSPQSEALSIVSYIGCAISIACLLFTIIMLIALRYVCMMLCALNVIIICRKKVFSASHHFVHLNLCFALLFGLITFVSGIQAASEYRVRARLCSTYCVPYIYIIMF